MDAMAIGHHVTNALEAYKAGARPNATALSSQATAREQAESFEATFLNSMFQEMFTATEGEGPMGSGAGGGVWRSFLTDEFAKAFAKNGGVGLAEPVYRSLLAIQEAAAAG